MRGSNAAIVMIVIGVIVLLFSAELGVLMGMPRYVHGDQLYSVVMQNSAAAYRVIGGVLFGVGVVRLMWPTNDDTK